MEKGATNVKVPLISKIAYGMGDVGCNSSHHGNLWMYFRGLSYFLFFKDKGSRGSAREAEAVPEDAACRGSKEQTVYDRGCRPAPVRTDTLRQKRRRFVLLYLCGRGCCPVQHLFPVYNHSVDHRGGLLPCSVPPDWE